MPSLEHFDITAEEYYFSINDDEYYTDEEEYNEYYDQNDNVIQEDNNETEQADIEITKWTTINLGGSLYDISDSGLIKVSGLFYPAFKGIPAHGTPYHYFEWRDIESGENIREWLHVLVYMAFNPDDIIPKDWEIRHVRTQPHRFYSNALKHLSIFPKIV